MTAPPSTETPRHTATPWILDGTSVYYLDWDGVSYEGKGKNYQQQLTNRFWFSLQGSPKRIPKEELEANAAFIVTAVNSHASLTAKVAELEADLVRLSAVWIVETQRVEKLETALGLARNRIEYLGVACINPRHHQANCDEFLPRIDAALDNADGGRGT